MKVDFKRWRVDGEMVFTATLLVIAVYMFVGSSEFSPRAATFPRVISGAAIVGCGLLLTSRYLPESARAFIREEVRVVEHDDPERPDTPEVGAAHGDRRDTDPTNSVYTTLLIGGYVLTAYLVGFLVATPLFIVAYALLFDIDRLYGGVLLLVSVGIIYGFELALNVPLSEGLLLTVVG